VAVKSSGGRKCVVEVWQWSNRDVRDRKDSARTRRNVLRLQKWLFVCHTSHKKYSPNSAVLQIRRSLVRSQLVSVDFSLT